MGDPGYDSYMGSQRDDFSPTIKETLGKRVAYHCSNPECQKLTTGPQENPAKAVNLGVAAHITGAAPGGPRYDSSLSSGERKAIENGIWLCQTCAKLVDNDEKRYPSHTLQQWKEGAEKRARSAMDRNGGNGPKSLNDGIDFAALEKIMPELFGEMRQDLSEHPLRREFVLLRKNWVYWAKGHELAYHYDDYPELDNMMHILENHGAITEITHSNAKRFLLSEELVKYLVR